LRPQNDDGHPAVLDEIRAGAGQWSEAEIRADVEAALLEAQALSPEERARLDDELSAVLSSRPANGG